MSSTVYYEMSSLDKHVRTPPNHTDTLASTLDHLSNPKYTNLPNLPLLNKNRRYFATKQKYETQHFCSFSVFHSPSLILLVFPSLFSISPLFINSFFQSSPGTSSEKFVSFKSKCISLTQRPYLFSVKTLQIPSCYHVITYIIKELIVSSTPPFILEFFCLFYFSTFPYVLEKLLSDSRIKRILCVPTPLFFSFNHRDKNISHRRE